MCASPSPLVTYSTILSLFPSPLLSSAQSKPRMWHGSGKIGQRAYPCSLLPMNIYREEAGKGANRHFSSPTRDERDTVTPCSKTFCIVLLFTAGWTTLGGWMTSIKYNERYYIIFQRIADRLLRDINWLIISVLKVSIVGEFSISGRKKDSIRRLSLAGWNFLNHSSDFPTLLLLFLFR